MRAPCSRARGSAMHPAAFPGTEPLSWHPRFVAHTTAHGQVVLLEDGDAVLFEAGPTTRIAQAVTAHASAREIMELDGSPAVLDELVALDLVQPAEAYRAAA